MLNKISTDMLKAYGNHRPQGREKQPMIPRQEALTGEDKVSLDEKPAETVTYGIPQKAEVGDSDYITLREMIVNMLEGQGLTTRIAAGDTTIDFKEITPGQARELISEDGYYGVEKTSDRIVQFAISLSGDDPSRLQEIKAAIEKGFQMAAEAMGGTLPDISTQIHDAVMDKLDAWVNGIDRA